MASATTGIIFGKQLVRALKLPPGLWSRIVIVADVDEPAKVYVKGYLNADAVPAIVMAVEDITVDDEGNVHVVEHKEPANG